MPDAVNIQAFMYVGFRLAPFVLVSFFALSSIFNSDVKGFIFLGLLLINCFIAMSVGNLLPADTSPDTNGVCKSMSLSKNGPMSNLPLNINVLSFTFSYLVYIIATYRMEKENIPTLTLFPLFIMYQLYWSTTNKCNTLTNSIISMVLGGGIGAFFSYMVDKSGIVQLQYFNGISNAEVCSRPSNQKFKCTSKAKV